MDASSGARQLEALQAEVAALEREREALAGECLQLRALIDNVPEYLYTKDLQGRYVLNNRTNLHLLESLSGIQGEEEARGKTVFDFFPPDIAERFQEDDQRVLESGQPVVDRQEPFVDEHGRAKWYWTTKAPIQDASGNVVGLAGVSRDVTVHLQALKALEERERDLRLALNAAQFGVWTWNGITRKLHLSKEFLTLTNLPPEANDGSLETFLGNVHPDDLSVIREVSAELRRHPTVPTHVSFTYRLLSPTGEIRWISVQGETEVSPEGELIGSRGISMDVTEREVALRAAREQGAHLRMALDAARMAAWSWDAETDRMHLSQEVFALLDADPAGFDGTVFGCLEYVHPEDREEFLRFFRHACDTVEMVGLVEHRYRVLAGQGETRWFHTRGHVERDGQGKPSGMRGIVLDVTDSVRAEGALRESEERYRALVDVCPDAIYVEAQGQIVFANRACAELFGAQDAQDLVGMPYAERHHPEDLPAIRERRRQSLSSGEPHDLEEERILRLDGEIRWVEVVAAPFTYQDGRALQVVLRDITERKGLEEQLLQAQKLETVGRLAGGIAHDFNNLLTAIMGYAEMAEMVSAEDARVLQYTRGVRDAADRAAHLTQQLLAFARKQIIATRRADANQLVLGVDRFVRRLIGADIEVVTLPSTAPCPVRVDVSQMEQVLLNLAINARDAMPDGGRLVMEVRPVTVDASRRDVPAETPPGRYVRISVRDNGTGIDPAIHSRVFEPFFTTKEHGKGTGLGLATAYGIIRQHEGYLYLESTPGAGSVFHVLLRADGAGELEPSAQPRPASIPRGAETILVVEDEPLVRELAVSTLRTLGYRVLEAAHGEEALRVAEGHAGPIHLLVTDLVMPRMGGLALAKELGPSRPAMRVLLASGYSDEMALGSADKDGQFPFLPKPYSPAVLASTVRSLLDSPLPAS